MAETRYLNLQLINQALAQQATQAIGGWPGLNGGGQQPGLMQPFGWGTFQPVFEPADFTAQHFNEGIEAAASHVGNMGLRLIARELRDLKRNESGSQK